MNKQNVIRRTLLIIVVALAPCFSSLNAVGQNPTYTGATITGTAYAFSGRFAGRSAQFRLNVNKYTSGDDVQRLNDALESGGQDGLLSAISGMSAGRVTVGTGVGVDANVILANDLPNGETKLTVIFERVVRFSELRYGTRSADYKFGYAELYMRRNTEGQGTLIPAAKIRLRDGKTWEVEDFGTFPARLMGLRTYGARVPR